MRGGVLALGLALALTAGCQRESFEEKYAPGEIDIYDDLYAVTAVGPDDAWVAGYFGAVYRTRDAGKHWRKLETPTEISLYDIDFVTSRDGWVVGRRGLILHTTDSGDSWERQKLKRQPAQHIFSIAALTPQTAWAVGEWGGRYVTHDSGKTWEDHSFLVTEGHPSFRYLTEQELATYYSGGKIYDDMYLNDVTFLDPQHGWIIGEYGFTYWTDNGGDSWQKGRIVGELKIEPVEFHEGQKELDKSQWDPLFSVAEKLLEKEYLRIRIEGCLTPAELAKYETYIADERADSVRDFLEGEGVGQERIRVQNATPMDQEEVDMVAFAKTKLCDGPPKVFINLLETPFLFDVKFKDPMNGIVAGLGGVMLRSSDGGRTWGYVESNSKQAVFSADFGSAAVVAVGERGLQRVSLDGGFHFEKPPQGAMPKLFTFMRDLRFATPERGWIVGAKGMVLRSDDGGLTWSYALKKGGASAAERDAAGE